MWIDDQIILCCDREIACEVWVPDSTLVVLGSSNDLELECEHDRCVADGVEIVRRRGGGGAVVLHPGVVVVSLGIWVEHRYRNKEYFDLLNGSCIEALALSFPGLHGSLSLNGISDIVHGKRKIAGTSMFRSRNYLLYQASILVEAKAGLFHRYLKHPSKEPAYREKKGHSDFVIGLSEIDSSIGTSKVLEAMTCNFNAVLQDKLGMDLRPPFTEQIEHLKERAAQA